MVPPLSSDLRRRASSTCTSPPVAGSSGRSLERDGASDRWWNDPDRAVRRFIDELVGYAEATNDDVGATSWRWPLGLKLTHRIELARIG